VKGGVRSDESRIQSKEKKRGEACLSPLIKSKFNCPSKGEKEEIGSRRVWDRKGKNKNSPYQNAT